MNAFRELRSDTEWAKLILRGMGFQDRRAFGRLKKSRQEAIFNTPLPELRGRTLLDEIKTMCDQDETELREQIEQETEAEINAL